MVNMNLGKMARYTDSIANSTCIYGDMGTEEVRKTTRNNNITITFNT